MESLDAAMLSMDALFDFSSDIGEEHNEDDERKSCKKASSLDSRTKHSAVQNHRKRRHHGRQQPQLRFPAESDSDADRRSFPVSVEEEEEEELEWLSSQDVFPSIETFDILPHKPSFTSPKHQSPVSVLENNTTSSNINTNIPVRGARSERRRRRRTSFSTLISTTTNTIAAAAATTITTDAALSTIRRKCQHCLAEKTPQWRAGPMGPKTLCNACGVRYKSGRLVPEYRPASSPSFSGELHSNSHRKILEMRRKKGKGKGKGMGIRGW